MSLYTKLLSISEDKHIPGLRQDYYSQETQEQKELSYDLKEKRDRIGTHHVY